MTEAMTTGCDHFETCSCYHEGMKTQRELDDSLLVYHAKSAANAKQERDALAEQVREFREVSQSSYGCLRAVGDSCANHVRRVMELPISHFEALAAARKEVCELVYTLKLDGDDVSAKWNREIIADARAKLREKEGLR